MTVGLHTGRRPFLLSQPHILMIPALHPSCNLTLGPAKGDEATVGSLPVFRHERGVASFWLPTPAEIYAINRGEVLVVNLSLDLSQHAFPPMAVGTHADIFEAPGTVTQPNDTESQSYAKQVPFDVAVMVHGPRSEIVRYLRHVADAVELGSISGTSETTFPGVTGRWTSNP